MEFSFESYKFIILFVKLIYYTINFDSDHTKFYYYKVKIVTYLQLIRKDYLVEII